MRSKDEVTRTAGFRHQTCWASGYMRDTVKGVKKLGNLVQARGREDCW